MEKTVKIEKNIFGGNALAFDKRKAIFIPYAIPGEIIQVKITDQKKDYDLAEIKKIISPSSDRITPQCPNFTICGGCSYLHMNYEREITEKVNIIKDNLIRIGNLNLPDIPEIEILNGERFHYRSHAQIKKIKNNKAGFFQKNSNKIISFPENGCLLLNKKISNQINSIDSLMHNNYKIAIDTEKNCYYSSENSIIIKESVNDIIYSRDIFSFFQANAFLRSKMLDKVEKYAEPLKNKTVLDIDCGIGFFTLNLSKKCNKITGYDINKIAIDFAIANSKMNKITNTVFKAKKSADIHPHNNISDIIVVDPPRAGIDKKTRYLINTIYPKKIIYISCNPSTWSRDIKDFTKNNYTLKKICFLDMFPCTSHIELISLLEKNIH